MNRLQPWQFGFAEAVTFSVFDSACALAVALFPDNTIGFFNAWFHGLDLTLLRPPGGRPLTLGQFLYGLVACGAGQNEMAIWTTFSFVFCVDYGLLTPSGVHMYAFLEQVLPGFEWLSWRGFSLG